MSLIGIIGILISIAGFRFARAGESRTRFVFFALLLLMHLGATLASYLYSQEFGGDALMYYYDNHGIYGAATGLSTIFVVNFVQFLKEYLGGSLFDYFLLFQSMGFWGILFILKSFDDIHEELGQPTFKKIYLLLFLPGVHYWTTGIGKDAPVFLGVAMCIWAAFRLQTRYLAFGVGVLIALSVRPHIALLVLVALAMTLLLARGTSLLMRAGLMVVVLGGIGAVSGLVEGTVGGLNLSSADSVAEVLESKSQMNESSGADLNIVGASFPIKLVSLLFRPFFIDANGVFGYVASVENLILLIVFVILIRRYRIALAVTRSTMFARFSFFLFCMIIFLLALVNYNVGLGLRQKMMAIPALLVFFVAMQAVRSVRTAAVYGPAMQAYAGAPATQVYRRRRGPAPSAKG